MIPFLSEDFLLTGQTARVLYHDFAERMPIFDFHSHLPLEDIASNRRFQNLTQIRLQGYHYKWRAMRASGVDEKFIAGDASDEEKFHAWAQTVPKTLGNPLFLWTHLEPKRYFGVSGKLLCRESAMGKHESCSYMLRTGPFRAQDLLERMNVKVLFTTQDPLQELSSHLLLQENESFPVKVLPCFRPDRAMEVDDTERFLPWLEKLQDRSQVEITDHSSRLKALDQRHRAFRLAGCRASDQGLDRVYCKPFDQRDADAALKKALRLERPIERETTAYRTAGL